MDGVGWVAKKKQGFKPLVFTEGHPPSAEHVYFSHPSKNRRAQKHVKNYQQSQIMTL